MIGVEQRDIASKIGNLVPDYMVMGDKGMADMGSMEMALPSNTLPMMTGQGPFGSIEMGGMFTMVKVRDGLARGDYKDPGWYPQPANTRAYEWTGAPLAEPKGATGEAQATETSQPILNVTKGSRHGSH
jgi:hypothetical protein